MNSFSHFSSSDCSCIPDDIMVHCHATDTIEVDSAGYVYNNVSHKFSIEFPQGAIPLAKHVYVSIGIMLNGPFIFPSDMKPISPIYWICIHPEVKLLKSVRIRLPHIMDCEGRAPTDIPMYFAKALHHNHTNDQHGKVVYSFDKKNKVTIIHGQQAEFETDHFCFTCLIEHEDKNKKHLYCCIPTVDYNKSEIYLVVTYLLDTCIEVTQNHFFRTQVVLNIFFVLVCEEKNEITKSRDPSPDPIEIEF